MIIQLNDDGSITYRFNGSDEEESEKAKQDGYHQIAKDEWPELNDSQRVEFATWVWDETNSEVVIDYDQQAHDEWANSS